MCIRDRYNASELSFDASEVSSDASELSSEASELSSEASELGFDASELSSSSFIARNRADLGSAEYLAYCRMARALAVLRGE